MHRKKKKLKIILFFQKSLSNNISCHCSFSNNIILILMNSEVGEGTEFI
jgi:hypothetical protein